MTARDSALRGICVLDAGSTNVKALLFDSGLNLVASRGQIAVRHDRAPWLTIDLEPAIAFFRESLAAFDRILPVDAIVPCSHGSSAVLAGADGMPVLPVMSYEAAVPERIATEYARIEPPFSEVFAPVNPLALTLARQLLWQETDFPADFAAAQAIMPIAQYVAFRLCGVASCEVSALGAQTHLWAPLSNRFSTLAAERGWAQRFAPMRKAWETLATARDTGLAGKAAVLAGVHDSNANLVPWLGLGNFTLLSTGTWIIAFSTGNDIRRLDPAYDQVSNTNVFAEPVACCRFMGGREFEIASAGADPALASADIALDLLERGVRAWPSFTDSGGPVPGSGGLGRVEGALDSEAERASLASLYCAMMTAIALKRMQAAPRIVVDGPFAANACFCQALAALLPHCEVHASRLEQGTARGAASLALIGEAGGGREALAHLPAMDAPQRIAAHAGLAQSHAARAWLAAVEAGEMPRQVKS
jgi:L-fuculokinase